MSARDELVDLAKGEISHNITPVIGWLRHDASKGRDDSDKTNLHEYRDRLDKAAHAVTDAILAAGYQKTKVLGYIVVDRGGVMVGNQHKHRESAQAFADEWTADCKTGGVDWDYRVATITEPSA